MIMPAWTGRKDYIDMENTRENVVILLEEMRKTSFRNANTIKFTDSELARVMKNHALDYQMCIWLLTDPDFFKDIWMIYFDEEVRF